VLNGGLASTVLPAGVTGSNFAATYIGAENFAPSGSFSISLITVADAAGYNSSRIAPGEIASLFGSGLANSGVSVQITDSSAVARPVPLIAVSPTRVSFVVPADSALGPAVVTLTNENGVAFSRAISVTRTAPGLFAISGSGDGPAAAQITRVHPDGARDVQNTTVFDDKQKQWISVPIAFGTDTLYLALFGTGIRNRLKSEDVVCNVNGLTLPAVYAAAHADFPALDQINVLLPPSLKGTGQVDLTIAVDGHVSNVVTVTFQ